MAMTEEERFLFDLNGFLVRPAILEPDEITAIIEQVDGIHHNKESLPPEQRQVPGGATNILIDHPQVIDVLHEVIGPDIRLENAFSVWREKGQRHGDLHGGGPQQGDPIFGYRTVNGRIYAGMVRVIFELTAVQKSDGATVFIPGSHKANFPMHPNHMSLDKPSAFLTGYECPAGSAIFFTENLCHAGPVWNRDSPRVAVLHAYAHLATHWHRLNLSREVIESLPREKQAYFRETWYADFRTSPTTINTIERFVNQGDHPA